jgi:cell wall-associated NlpC family hydrolase
MDERSQRKMVQRIAMSYLGTFYIWGGDDPSGFDCSGLAIECLKSVGVLPREGDWTAQDLSAMFPRVDPPQGGDLVFWTSLQAVPMWFM